MRLARAVRLWLATMLTLIALHAFGPAGQSQAESQVHLLTIDGVINPLTAQYLTRELPVS